MKIFKWLITISLLTAVACGGGNSIGSIDKDVIQQEVTGDTVQDSAQEISGRLAVDTKVDKEKYKAGEVVNVTCVITGDTSGTVGTEISVLPTDGVTRTQGGFKIIKTGAYQATCSIKGSDVKDPTPATFTVIPGDPANIELTATPKKDGFKIGDRVKIKAAVTDAYDNTCTDFSLNPFKYTPTDVAGDVPNKPGWLEFAKEGKVTVTVSVKSFDSVKGDISFWCDENPPVIVITNPARGAMLTGDTKVEVQGTVKDEVSGVQSVTINGQTVEPDTDGSFLFVIDSVQSMNLIDLEATDNAGNASKDIQTYLFSDKYYADMNTPDPAKALVADAIDAWVDKTTLDDGNHDPSDLNDLSTIVEVLLLNLDWNSLVPSPAAQDIGLVFARYDLYLKNISIKSDHVAITPGSGFLKMKVDLNKFHSDFTLKKKSGIGGDINGSMDADSISLEMKIFPQVGQDGKITSEIKDVNIQTNGLSVKVGISIPLDLLKGIIENLLKDQITKQVGPALDNALNALNMDMDFPLKPFIGTGDPLNLHLKTQVKDLTFTDAGMFAGMLGSLTAPKMIEPVNPSLGSIGRGTCLKNKRKGVLPQQKKIEIGAFDDLLNQALFALWWGGLLDIDATDQDLGQDLSQYGIKSLHLVTKPYLPPVINGCRDDDNLFVQLGDMGVSVDLDMGGEGHTDMFLSLEARLVLGVGQVDGKIMITFDIKDTKVYVQFINTTGSLKGKEKMLEGLIKTALVDQLLGALKKKIPGFAIPSIDLHSLMDSIPEGTNLNITPEELQRILGYTVLTAHLGK